jgi:hypothetical protein
MFHAVKKLLTACDAAWPGRAYLWGDGVFAPFGLSPADVAALREALRDWPR